VVSRDRRAGPVAEGTARTYEFTYDGNDQEVSELLKQLVGAGIPIVSFGRKKEGLEELFLKVGARAVS
jgi:ABC-2 type transport system ATP-binding protein